MPRLSLCLFGCFSYAHLGQTRNRREQGQDTRKGGRAGYHNPVYVSDHGGRADGCYRCLRHRLDCADTRSLDPAFHVFHFQFSFQFI